ncbi:Endoglucanase [Alloactinosynnema sp. L-07]|uniref:transglycosylase family protein n=1 Tax=Alloactinosynnema sp. L-07 TaxID=1653480 RepID=UPI00065EFAE9|nr:transglycosylase family protein [Alloactinosynnema sp. L-07]CRK57164.1 Endoglucanase [Alloactinosynnema sp. L-07]
MAGKSVRRGISRLVLLVLTIGTAAALTGGSAAADPPAGDWGKLRMCESSGRYTVNTGSGYYGAYQFDLPTWRSVGGAGYPHQASPAEQDFRALYLYRMRGWQPWECAGMVGLVPDRDARSKRVPTRAESAYIGGGSSAPPSVNIAPAWPGKVYVFGDCDPSLRAWQLRMNAYGYDFQGTGCYFAETQRAVLALQRANGINDSGKLGPKTWRAAWEGVAPRR